MPILTALPPRKFSIAWMCRALKISFYKFFRIQNSYVSATPFVNDCLCLRIFQIKLKE